MTQFLIVLQFKLISSEMQAFKNMTFSQDGVYVSIIINELFVDIACPGLWFLVRETCKCLGVHQFDTAAVGVDRSVHQARGTYA